jgi:hypothetical protein
VVIGKWVCRCGCPYLLRRIWCVWVVSDMWCLECRVYLLCMCLIVNWMCVGWLCMSLASCMWCVCIHDVHVCVYVCCGSVWVYA